MFPGDSTIFAIVRHTRLERDAFTCRNSVLLLLSQTSQVFFLEMLFAFVFLRLLLNIFFVCHLSLSSLLLLLFAVCRSEVLRPASALALPSASTSAFALSLANGHSNKCFHSLDNGLWKHTMRRVREQKRMPIKKGKRIRGDNVCLLATRQLESE